MKWSNYFIPTLKEVPVGAEAISHQLLHRAGLVHMLTSGVYTYLPLGLRVLSNIEKIIREEMNATGACELLMPSTHPIDIWKQTGRDKVLEDVMFKFEDKRGRKLCLGPTHEEIITDLVKNFVQSYRQLPVVLYQIQTKFRDEMRPRFGIVRACEFIMKDAYSFDIDVESMQKNYNRMYEAYKKVFKRLGLDVAVISADSGAMGGDVSHEYMVPAPIGEDQIIVCDKCSYRSGIKVDFIENQNCPDCKCGKLKSQVAIEIGHIFQLGTKYSKALNAVYVDEAGIQKPIIMGCYGIGVSRVISAIIEKHNDSKGIIWPKEVAPFQVEIVVLSGKKEDDDQIEIVSRSIYNELISCGLEVLMDDRNETAGRKFNDADLIGIPIRITIGRKQLLNNKVEIKQRYKEEISFVELGQVKETIISLIKS